ncbi:MAG: excinuclease ABC subunit UvrA [Planctomycetota bacterium]
MAKARKKATPDTPPPAFAEPGNRSRNIVVRGARHHNLRDISLELPREQLILFTGLSGSGKSTLAFDTIYAEGQRRYVESLSTFARQFLDQLPRPDCDEIEGLPPTIAVEQRAGQANPRSTVATTTEIFDYLRLLYARVGTPHCPVCGLVIKRESPQEIVDRVGRYPEKTKVLLLAPLVRRAAGSHRDVLLRIKREGYLRARIDGKVEEIARIPELEDAGALHTIEAVVDRLVIRPDMGNRLADSIELALKFGEGQIVVARQEPAGNGASNGGSGEGGPSHADELDDMAERIAERRRRVAEGGDPGDMPTDPDEIRFALAGLHEGGGNGANAEGWIDERFSELYACPENHVAFEPFTPRSFSFNSPHGWCERCEGLGTTMEANPELCVPDVKAPLIEAIEPWAKAGRRLAGIFRTKLESFCERAKINPKTAWKNLPDDVQHFIMQGGAHDEVQRRGLTEWECVLDNLARRFRETDSVATREKIMEYMTERDCPDCKGSRLGAIQRAVTIGGLHIGEFCALTVEEAIAFVEQLKLPAEHREIADPILAQVRNRLRFMHGVGLEYLTLDRRANTLSGGEAQRIRLATQVGSGLVGVCYVLDEPSIGLHQRDNERLLKTLRHLRDIGNSVIVVEHDPDFIRAADHVVDLGPGAGHLGGQLIFQGDIPGLEACDASITGAYLSGKKRIPPRLSTRKVDRRRMLEVRGGRENNLKNIEVQFPLGVYTCVTGVSGSGKSTLVTEILLKTLQKVLHRAKVTPGKCDIVKGTSLVDKVIEIDQSPIGRSPRSNPATYTSIFNEVRNVYALTREAKVRGYDASRFSFNVKGGRCEACQGQGLKRVEMHFLPDIFVTCDVCKGHRFNRETLEIRYRGQSISDVLDMTISEAVEFFVNFPKLARMLQTLEDVGVGYIRLGQPSNTLSGGEAQRVKLAAELGRPPGEVHTVYILDEPSTGLHFADVARLLQVLNQLVDSGNTVIVIEHNLDMIRTADWIIDLGPEGGHAGGTVVAEGTPEQVAANRFSHTGRFLKPLLEE